MRRAGTAEVLIKFSYNRRITEVPRTHAWGRVDDGGIGHVHERLQEVDFCTQGLSPFGRPPSPIEGRTSST